MKKYQKWFENVEIQNKNLIKISTWHVWINVELSLGFLKKKEKKRGGLDFILFHQKGT
jgi:hypothetical protein